MVYCEGIILYNGLGLITIFKIINWVNSLNRML